MGIILYTTMPPNSNQIYFIDGFCPVLWYNGILMLFLLIQGSDNLLARALEETMAAMHVFKARHVASHERILLGQTQRWLGVK
jgi:hypothetical protein